MNILLTGGAGFIGSHLAEKLLKMGHNVFCLDNFNDFYDPAIKKKNIGNCLSFQYDKRGSGQNRYTLLTGDIREQAFLKKIFAENSFDLVIHLAAMAGVRPSIINPGLYYDVNITGTHNLLENCRIAGIKKFILASSSSIYGNNKKVPFAESDPVDSPISPYAASKKSAELICHCYHHLYQISTVCLRYFTVYGPRQRPDLAIHKFTKLLVEGKSLPLFGDPDSKRDYTYIDDILAGTIKAVDYVTNNDVYEIFNLGESRTIPLSAMISILEKNLGLKARIDYLPSQDGDVWQTYASIEKSKRILGYDPIMSFEEGIKIFVDWFRQEKLTE